MGNASILFRYRYVGPLTTAPNLEQRKITFPADSLAFSFSDLLLRHSFIRSKSFHSITHAIRFPRTFLGNISGWSSDFNTGDTDVRTDSLRCKTVESARLPFHLAHSQISSDSIRPNLGPTNGKFFVVLAHLESHTAVQLWPVRPLRRFALGQVDDNPDRATLTQRQPTYSSCLSPVLRFRRNAIGVRPATDKLFSRVATPTSCSRPGWRQPRRASPFRQSMCSSCLGPLHPFPRPRRRSFLLRRFNRTCDIMATAVSSEDEQPSVIDTRRAPAARQEPNLVYGATVQLPTFDKLEPRAWFRIADANFGIRWVTDPVTKYYYVLSKLDSETLRKLSAFLDLPLSADPYLDIRKKLCATFEPPLKAKLDTFLATNDAGDERPAQFGLELQRLLANATTDDLRKRVFLRSLKPSIVTAITGSLAANFETVMAAADKAWMAAANSDPSGTPATVSAISHSTSSAPRGNGRGGRGARGGRQCEPRPSGRVESVPLCHFHRKFGDAARKCASGCSRWTEPRPRDAPARVSHIEEALDGEDAHVGTDLENF